MTPKKHGPVPEAKPVTGQGCLQPFGRVLAGLLIAIARRSGKLRRLKSAVREGRFDAT